MFLSRALDEAREVFGVAEGALIHDDDALEGGHFAGGGQLFILLAGGEDEDFGTGVPDAVAKLLRIQGGVEGYIDGAEGEDGEVGDGPLPAVFAEDGDAIAFDDAPTGEEVSEGADAAIELG